MSASASKCVWRFDRDQIAAVVREWSPGPLGQQLGRRVKWIDVRKLNRIEWSKRPRKVATLAAQMCAGAAIPPAVGRRPLHGGSSPIFVVDGNHRIEAAIAAGMTRIPILVYES